MGSKGPAQSVTVPICLQGKSTGESVMGPAQRQSPKELVAGEETSLKAPFWKSTKARSRGRRLGWCTASTKHRVALALHQLAAALGFCQAREYKEGTGACHR